MRMKWTALLAVAVFMLAVGSATAAPKTIRGTVVAKRAHGRTVVLATGRTGLAVTVHAQPYFEWHFDKWTMTACDHVVGTACTFQANGTSPVGAKFRKDD